jgi:hypothetical protein
MTASVSAAAFTVFRGFPEKGCYTWSPFVTKLEARLRFDGISYSVDAGSPLKAPRGKVPYVTFEHDGQSQSIGDSGLIANLLIEVGYLNDLNSRLSPVEKAHDISTRALLEDKLYFYQVHNTFLILLDSCQTATPFRWSNRFNDRDKNDGLKITIPCAPRYSGAYPGLSKS